MTNEIDQIHIDNEDIVSFICKFYPKILMVLMAYLLLLCDASVVLPLRIIFGNILSTAKYPDIWKLANVIPIFKKGDKQLIENYRLISLLQLCGKIFAKINKHLTTHHLITKNQSGFRLAILLQIN